MVVEHTFFLVKSHAVAALCQYTFVSFTMTKGIGAIQNSGCLSESSNKWVTITYWIQINVSTLMQREIIAVKHRAVNQRTFELQCQSGKDTELLCMLRRSAKSGAPWNLI